ncbi:unnamed protein product [Prunus brigantina]
MSLNSQMFHIVRIKEVKVNAAGNSPNTDGIHVQLSRNVAIFNTSIKTGDDCVSIGPGTKDLWIEQITCGPGLGIRIKSWARPSNGFVLGVQFLDVVVFNVQNPILLFGGEKFGFSPSWVGEGLIDQNYCPHNINCPAQVSGVKVSDVIYRNIQGTSAIAVTIKFDCSATNLCSGIRLGNVSLTCRNQEVQSHCANAIGKIVGTVQPNSCLQY